MSGGTVGRCALSQEFFLKSLSAERLPPLPAAGVPHDLVMLIVNRDRGRISFDRELAADIARRHIVAITVELHSQVLVDDDLGRIPVIRVEGRERSQCLHAKTLFGRLSGFPMLPAIGDFVQPLAHLAIHVRQIGERTQRPEVAPEVTDSAFDLSFFPSRRYMTRTREEAIFTSESQEAGIYDAFPLPKAG